MPELLIDLQMNSEGMEPNGIHLYVFKLQNQINGIKLSNLTVIQKVKITLLKTEILSKWN